LDLNSILTTKMAAVNNMEVDYTIKPEALVPTQSSEDWPLLLKNYEKRTCETFFRGSEKTA
jgi:H/ACA ribonucleoprotein complex subunit 4